MQRQTKNGAHRYMLLTLLLGLVATLVGANVLPRANAADPPAPLSQGTTCTTYNSSDTPIAIPDEDETGVTSYIGIVAPGYIYTATVSVNLTHTWFRDLNLYLCRPDGCRTLLAGGFDFYGLYEETYTFSFYDYAPTPLGYNPQRTGDPVADLLYKPSVPMALNSLPVAGTWGLRAIDDSSADTGTLNSWSITMCTTSARATVAPSATFRPLDCRQYYSFAGWFATIEPANHAYVSAHPNVAADLGVSIINTNMQLYSRWEWYGDLSDVTGNAAPKATAWLKTNCTSVSCSPPGAGTPTPSLIWTGHDWTDSELTCSEGCPYGGTDNRWTVAEAAGANSSGIVTLYGARSYFWGALENQPDSCQFLVPPRPCGEFPDVPDIQTIHAEIVGCAWLNTPTPMPTYAARVICDTPTPGAWWSWW